MQEKMMVMMLPVVIHNYAPKLTAKTEQPKFIFPFAAPTPVYPARIPDRKVRKMRTPSPHQAYPAINVTPPPG